MEKGRVGRDPRAVRLRKEAAPRKDVDATVVFRGTQRLQQIERRQPASEALPAGRETAGETGRQDWERLGRDDAHIDHVTDDLTGFLGRIAR